MTATVGAPAAEAAIAALAARIPPLDAAAMARARARQASLVKPAGALGRLEELAVRIAGMTGSDWPPHRHKLVVVFAADHGVAGDGVSAYPSAITAQMIATFAAGKAAINLLAAAAGARLVVVDVGVAADLPPGPPILHRKVRPGTASLAAGPAMTRAEAVAAMAVGAAIVEDAVRRGLDLLALGEMGIGNTTAAAALAAALLDRDPADLVGRGTGLDAAGMARKLAAVRRGLAANRPTAGDPIGALAAVGGLEIAALAGAVLAAAAARRPILLDGYVVGVAALAATRFAPAAASYLIAAHRSTEPGHGPVLAALGLRPLLDLDLRLGEASGAALALPLVAAALAAHAGMATFAEAGLDGPSQPGETPTARSPSRLRSDG